MAKYRLNANSVVDMLTPSEAEDILSRQTMSWFQEQQRGFTTARFDTSGTPDTGALTMPAGAQRPIGPQDGFAWTVRRLSVYGLADGDVLSVYRNDVIPGNFIGQLTFAVPMLQFDKTFVLRGNDSIIFDGTSLGTDPVYVNGEAIETSELDIYKMLG